MNGFKNLTTYFLANGSWAGELLLSPTVHLSSLCIKLRGLVSALLFPYQTEVLILDWEHMFKEEFQIMHTRCFPVQLPLLL